MRSSRLIYFNYNFFYLDNLINLILFIKKTSFYLIKDFDSCN